MPFPVLPAPLLAALTARGYAEPTPVQAAVLTPETAGRDLLVSAQTGSGKTVAFGLAMATELMGEAERLPPPGAPLALVVAPTRELALQVQAELAWLYAPAGGRVVTGVGGTDPIAERRALSRGAQIVVGTPGRLRDHLERGNLDPAAIRAVVLDEADEMLDMGFREELEAILETTPAERRTLMFSATVPKGIAQLAARYQRDALRIAAGDEGAQHGDIDYRALLIAPHEMERAVVNALRFFEARAAMVFCRTRATVARLHGNLAERGFAAVPLSGELSQAERNRALQGLRDGRARVCVATDVAARGIDLPDLGLVIHAELPNDPETLLHRSGRTGRAGRKGTSVLLVPYNRRRGAERLLVEARVRAEWGPAPSAEAIRAQDNARILEQARTLVAEEAAEDEQEMARQLLADQPAEALAAALIRQLRAPLPAPEELAAMAERAPPAPRGRRDNAAPQGDGQPGIWFRMSLGRNGNADPRWVLPFLCRRGNVTRQEIGRIRVMERETQFEVAPWAAQRFSSAIRRPAEDNKDAHIRIAPVEAARARR
ncbi:DEAD/DEAH box helicase [Siccirubricoccus sp. KC 17139]|uniref:DEAD/DEAH box helicase n=1 Tax=Siccirubricoccus soli TaxID=2899147 RepID=A0ABT1DA34_9PROT|nr:DEAD/DEAH box helicase [Siccirubricoccus soli]MCO6418790.1 DEAD/DEAH box helicase [Siccirubricoccus soli]MCP2684925.1 DEAD/DEAH box helicase [Siccirubricoccus soli]